MANLTTKCHIQSLNLVKKWCVRWQFQPHMVSKLLNYSSTKGRLWIISWWQLSSVCHTYKFLKHSPASDNITWKEYNNQVLTELKCNCISGYVDEIHVRKLLFSLPLKDLGDVLKKYEEKVPEPLNRQFPERLGKDDAIHNKEKKRGPDQSYFPPVNNNK